jgi:TatD DNase family protein
MILPSKGDYIDIHTHGSKPAEGIFSIETLMAHEDRMPEGTRGLAYTFGIHPWYLNETNHDFLIKRVIRIASNPFIIAIGEAGFDKVKGPVTDLQQKAFQEQVHISEDYRKPLVIHCVRAWEELIGVHKRLKPQMPWLVHGFRGKKELAKQLISRNMYLSFWFDFIMRPESTQLVRSLPGERIFLETDGAGVDIRDLYNKVAADRELETDELKDQIFKNFMLFFNVG